MPSSSSLILARAALILSDLRGVQSITLLKLTQSLLKQQVHKHTNIHTTVHIQHTYHQLVFKKYGKLRTYIYSLCLHFFQLCVFGQRVVDGKICFPPPEPNNIYLPHLNLLEKVTLQIGK